MYRPAHSQFTWARPFPKDQVYIHSLWNVALLRLPLTLQRSGNPDRQPLQTAYKAYLLSPQVQNNSQLLSVTWVVTMWQRIYGCSIRKETKKLTWEPSSSTAPSIPERIWYAERVWHACNLLTQAHKHTSSWQTARCAAELQTGPHASKNSGQSNHILYTSAEHDSINEHNANTYVRLKPTNTGGPTEMKLHGYSFEASAQLCLWLQIGSLM